MVDLKGLTLVEMEAKLRDMVSAMMGRQLTMNRRQFMELYDLRGLVKEDAKTGRGQSVLVQTRRGEKVEVPRNYGVQCGIDGGNAR